jgi:hypothetical protein
MTTRIPAVWTAPHRLGLAARWVARPDETTHCKQPALAPRGVSAESRPVREGAREGRRPPCAALNNAARRASSRGTAPPAVTDRRASGAPPPRAFAVEHALPRPLQRRHAPAIGIEGDHRPAAAGRHGRVIARPARVRFPSGRRPARLRRSPSGTRLWQCRAVSEQATAPLAAGCGRAVIHIDAVCENALHAHPVFCERACLVGADDTRAPSVSTAGKWRTRRCAAPCAERRLPARRVRVGNSPPAPSPR